MGKIEDIKFLRDKTGCGIASAKKVMELCKNKEIALEFIRLKGQALARYKYIDGRKIPWDNIDYYMEARKRVAERGNKKMKFYSEVTKEMYDTIEALQAAEEQASADIEKKEAVDTIMALVKEGAEIEKKTLVLMRDFDEKYGFGSIAREMLMRVNQEKKVSIPLDKLFTSTEGMNKNRTAVKQDDFINALDAFLRNK